MVLLLGAPVPEHADLLGELRLARHDHATFAVRAEVLAGIEAEAAHVAEASCTLALVLGTMCLRGILDHDQSMASGDCQDRVHLRHEAVQMDRHDRTCPGRDGSLDPGRINVQAVRVDVDEDRACTGVLYCGDRSNEGEWSRDYLVTRADARRENGKVQGTRAGVDADPEFRTRVGGELLLEARDIGPKNVLAILEHVADGGINFVLDAQILRLKVKKRDHDAFLR